MDVTLASSVDEFFHEVVTDALSAGDLEASEPASWYLVGLLGEMTRHRLTDDFYHLGQHAILESFLAGNIRWNEDGVGAFVKP